ncbi:MAG: sll1863 family stress response protein [Planctomycetota bacterium]
MSLKDTYIERIQAKLDQWSAELDKLEAKARDAKAGAKVSLQEHIDVLSQKRDDAKARLKEIRESSNGAWEDLKEGAEGAFDSLREAINKAKSHF